MPNVLPNWLMFPEEYIVHHKATPRDWDVSNARRLSLGPHSKAQYNPHRIGRSHAEDLGRICIREGIPLTDLTNQDLKQHKFYLDCRIYFNEIDFVSGYCDGEKVPFILVKWKCDGGYHGQPATKELLNKKGAGL